jgi:hypothetical protein
LTQRAKPETEHLTETLIGCNHRKGVTMLRKTPIVLMASAFVGFWGVGSPALAGAKIEFAEYSGVAIIETGEGGTKITKNGIDYWTSGKPPRRYQVIGRISDRRVEEWDGGHAIGSPTIAKKVKKAGGSAVILLQQDDTGAGSTGVGSFGGGLGSFFSVGGTKTNTTFVVVKYLD